MANANLPNGLMETSSNDNITRMKEAIFGSSPQIPQPLNQRLGALTDVQRSLFQMYAKFALMMMKMQHRQYGYSKESYDTLISRVNNGMKPELKSTLVELLETIAPIEVREEPEAKPNGRSIYDNPQFFPLRDTNNKGFDPRASRREEANAQQTKASSETVGAEETIYNSVNTALLKYSNTIAKIESANDYTVRGGYNNHYLGKYQMGKAALKDVGIDYDEEQEKFLADPKMQDDAFERFTEQNHDYLKSKSEKYRKMDLNEQLGILGYAHNQGSGGALKYLETGESQADGFGTDGKKYIDEVTKALSVV